MESLIQTHCGPPVVFIHIIDTFTFCFCLLSWIIFYLPEVNFFMTTAHFSFFLHGPIALVCVYVCSRNSIEIYSTSSPVHSLYAHLSVEYFIRRQFVRLNAAWKPCERFKSIRSQSHIGVLKKKKKLAEISSPSILHHISWYHDARIHTKLCNKKKIKKNDDDAMKIGVC